MKKDKKGDPPKDEPKDAKKKKEVVGSPLPHLHWDSARYCQLCTGNELAAATSAAPGLGPPRCQICTGTGPTPMPDLHRDLAHPGPHLHRDWALPYHICTGTGAPTPKLYSAYLLGPCCVCACVQGTATKGTAWRSFILVRFCRRPCSQSDLRAGGRWRARQ